MENISGPNKSFCLLLALLQTSAFNVPGKWHTLRSSHRRLWLQVLCMLRCMRTQPQHCLLAGGHSTFCAQDKVKTAEYFTAMRYAVTGTTRLMLGLFQHRVMVQFVTTVKAKWDPHSSFTCKAYWVPGFGVCIITKGWFRWSLDPALHFFLSPPPQVRKVNIERTPQENLSIMFL